VKKSRAAYKFKLRGPEIGRRMKERADTVMILLLARRTRESPEEVIFWVAMPILVGGTIRR